MNWIDFRPLRPCCLLGHYKRRETLSGKTTLTCLLCGESTEKENEPDPDPKPNTKELKEVERETVLDI